MPSDFVAIRGNCQVGRQRHLFCGDAICSHCEKMNPRYASVLYCHQCGYRHIIHESPAEGYSCPHCGSSDSDE